MAIQLPDVIGLPPIDEFINMDGMIGESSIDFVKKRFPILHLTPMIQSADLGLHVYKLKSGVDQFKKVLSTASNGEITVSKEFKNSIDICYQHTNQFSETYNSQFGDGLLASISSFMGPKLQEAIQLGIPGKMMSEIKNRTGIDTKKQIDQEINELKTSMSKFGFSANQATNIISQVVKGGKFNFPQLWKSSSFDVNYDIHVKLYNLNPNDLESHKKYIVGPIIALLAFINPLSTDGQTFKWPLMCTVEAPGLFHIKTGYVKTISVTKGGDSNSVGWNMRPSVVDIRISFGTAYNVKCAAESDIQNEYIPNMLNDYTILNDQKNIKTYKVKKLPNSPFVSPISKNNDLSQVTKDIIDYHKNADIATGEIPQKQATTESLKKEAFSIKRYIHKLGVSSQNLYNFTKNLSQRVQDGVNKTRDLSTKIRHGIDVATSIKSKFSQHTTNGNIAGIQGILGALSGMDNDVGTIASNLNSSISHSGNMVTQVSDAVKESEAGKYVSALNSISNAQISVQDSTTQIREAIPIASNVTSTATDQINEAKEIRDPSNPEFNDSMEILGEQLESTKSDAEALETNLVELNEAHNDNAEYITTRKNDLESIIN